MDSHREPPALPRTDAPHNPPALAPIATVSAATVAINPERAAPAESIRADEKHPSPPSAATANTDAKDSKVDEKKQDAIDPKKFAYLSDFSPAELAALKKKYPKQTLEQLDDQINDHWKSYWAERLKKYGAISTNFLYMFFRAMTSNKGINNVANLISPGTTVPSAVGYGLGVSFAVPGTLIYVFTASAKKDAILSILDYVNRDPFNQRVAQTLAKACEDKTQALLDSVEFIIKNSVTAAVNATAAASCVIPILDQLNTLSPVLKWSIIAGIGYLGFHYNGMCYNEAVEQGVAFYKNATGRTSLRAEIAKGNIAIPVEILLQGVISAAGLRAFPSYFFAAAKAGAGLGFFLPATLVAILTALHGLGALYPVTFNHYLGNLEKLREHIAKNIDAKQIDGLLEEQLKHLNLGVLTAETKEKHRKQIIAAIVEETINIMFSEHNKDKGYFSLFKAEPSTIIPTVITAGIGGYFGSQVLAPALASITCGPAAVTTALCAAAGAALFGGLFYRAEDNRVTYKLLAEKTLGDDKKTVNAPATRGDKVAEILATIFAVSNSISSATSAIGSLDGLPGGDTPLVKTGVTTAATKSGLNSIGFFQPKVEATLKSLFQCSETEDEEAPPRPHDMGPDAIELMPIRSLYPYMPPFI